MVLTLVNAATAAPAFSFAKVLVIIVLLGVGFPLIQRLRKTASERRKRRWVQEGLMDPPAPGPDAGKLSD